MVVSTSTSVENREPALGSELGSARQISSAMLKQLALDAGADDVGLVEIGRRELDPQRDEILKNYPWVKTLLSFVVRMTREPIRSPARSVANLEFHHAAHHCDDVSHKVVSHLESLGVRAVNPAMGFPMEMNQHPGEAVWLVSHKPVAVAAGLGHMGIHRNLIHPRFGNFVLLGTVLLDAEVVEHDAPIDYNPCLECRLCVAACPVGAISADGTFNFSACFTHNYREFMGGFTDWVEQIADSRDAFDYRRRVSESETASMWQSLTYGANYKAAYCMAVCPAGEDVIGPYLQDRGRHVQEVLKPLQERAETIYVVKGTDAEAIVRKRWKNKIVKPVGNALRARTIEAMLRFLPHLFQPNQSAGLSATYHFTFTGRESRRVTITIANRKLKVSDGHVGKANLRVTADSKAWLQFVAKERGLAGMILKGKLRLFGSPALLLAFGKCFPSPGVRHAETEILPQPSLIRNESGVFRQNDPTTGKLRWSGFLSVSAVREESPTVKTFRLTPLDGSRIPFEFRPGQFLTLEDGEGGAPAKRSYTIASSPHQRDHIEITVKREQSGLVSRWLHDTVTTGSTIPVTAPYGNFVFTGTEAGSLVLLGSGVGITPLMSVVRNLAAHRWDGRVQMFLGFRKPSEYLFREELLSLQGELSGLSVTAIMSKPDNEPWEGLVGRVDHTLLARHCSFEPEARYHICGPTGMMSDVNDSLRTLGIRVDQVKKEAFGTHLRSPANRDTGKVIGKAVFQQSKISAPIHEGASLLDVAEGAGVPIDNACRSGTCGMCKAKLISGDVTIAEDESLTPEDRTNGYILTCQAQGRGVVSVEI